MYSKLQDNLLGNPFQRKIGFALARTLLAYLLEGYSVLKIVQSFSGGRVNSTS